MTKQEIIQKAYGKTFDGLKDYINENGFVDCVKNRKISLIPFFDVSEIEFNGHLSRPKSLQGIETNNGWIKIESEADLPKEINIHYHGIKEGEYIAFTLKDPINIKALFRDFTNDKITHYKPIRKPELPIY